MAAEADMIDGLSSFGGICAANGVAIMLTLFAIWRLFPLIRTWRSADTSGLLIFTEN